MASFRVEFRTPNGGKTSYKISAANEWRALVSATINTAVQGMLVATKFGKSSADMLAGLVVSAEDGSLDIHIYEVYPDDEYEMFPTY